MTCDLLAKLPGLVCDQISIRLPKLAHCAAHAGPFSLDELKKTGLQSPAVLVSILGTKQGKAYAGQPPTYDLHMAAYIVTRDKLGLNRDAHAANVCQVLLSLIPNKNWGENAMGPAQDVQMRTLVSSQTKDHGASLWAVTWTQPVSFYETPDAVLDVELYVSMAPDTGADNAGKYEQIGGDNV